MHFFLTYYPLKKNSSKKNFMGLPLVYMESEPALGMFARPNFYVIILLHLCVDRSYV